MDLKQKAKTLKTNIPTIYLVFRDKDTPGIAKWMAGLTIAYALSPIDLIPDFIPVLGYLDDILILPAMIALTIHFIPKHVWEKNRQAAQMMGQYKIQKKWYYALGIIGIWCILIGVIMYIIIS